MDKTERKKWEIGIMSLADAYDYTITKNRLNIYIESLSKDWTAEQFDRAFDKILKDYEIKKFPMIAAIHANIYEADQAYMQKLQQQKNLEKIEAAKREAEENPITDADREEFARKIKEMF